MASSSSLASLLLLLLLLTCNPATAGLTSAALCLHSDTPALCLRISAHLSAATPVKLTESAIRAALFVAERARVKAASLSRSPQLNAQQRANLGTCVSSYGDVVDGLADAARLLGTARTRADVMNYLSAASFGVTACQDAFRETPRVSFPLARVNRTLRKYVSNALAMGDQLSSQW
ncbi:hypothetical protein HPP92_009334 [Vanilla planifolia]|uniref:Pectinesterase inhibitor domain-containing protein n=1 Tax=Vanilla planifolia TaxID=51239 RepID=A0A835V4M3_VANPL|nr:hypothetical protein HPP92_009558 [Vanilla planifolia]KAG0487239.1 hypothetical protein HPP92_009334 [Vanilla planifolia]